MGITNLLTGCVPGSLHTNASILSPDKSERTNYYLSHITSQRSAPIHIIIFIHMHYRYRRGYIAWMWLAGCWQIKLHSRENLQKYSNSSTDTHVYFGISHDISKSIVQFDPGVTKDFLCLEDSSSQCVKWFHFEWYFTWTCHVEQQHSLCWHYS